MRAHPAITVFTNAELMAKSGSFGNNQVTIAIHGDQLETIQLDVGSIVVATGFDDYEPAAGEFGYGLDGVVTLPEFKKMVDESPGPLQYKGRPVKTIAYIYCVGSRQDEERRRRPHLLLALLLHVRRAHRARGGQQARRGDLRQYHLYRDMRTYGKYELLWNESREKGSLYLRVPDDEPPAVEKLSSGGLKVTTKDLLTGGEEIAIPADLVVLVTGMVPRENAELVSVLKLPVGNDGFYNEIHPKLRPVETIVDGVLICGACQAPKTSAEAVASGLAAVDAERRHAQARLRRARPDGRDRRQRRLHLVRQVPGGLPLRRDRAGRGRRQAGRPGHQDRLQGLRWLRAGVPHRRRRPAGLHRRPDQVHDRRPPGGELLMTPSDNGSDRRPSGDQGRRPRSA